MASIDSDSVTVDPQRKHSSAAGWLWVPLGAAVVALLVVASAYGLVRLAHWTERYHPPVVTASENDAAFLLPADMASIHGEALTLQESNNQTFIKWTDVYGNASWRFFVPEGGIYDVALTYACAEGAQGSDLLIHIAGQELETETISTGDWDTWETHTLSQLSLDRGVHKVDIAAASMAGDEVMRLSAIEISPIKIADPAPDTSLESEPELSPQTQPELEFELEIPELPVPDIEPAPDTSDTLESRVPAAEDAPVESLDSSEVQATTPSIEESQQPQENP